MRLERGVIGISLAIVGACGCGSANAEGLGFDASFSEPLGSEVSVSETLPDTDFFATQAPLDNNGLAGECALTTLPLREEQRPVDVILVLDNSPSMESEIEAVELNVNRNFAAILEESGADYRLILLSRHRQRSRYEGQDDATSICVTSPLSGLPACPWIAPKASERFFHYSTTIDSYNSLRRIAETYLEPDEAYATTSRGWSAWLRPNSKKVFLVVTDDNASTSARTFIERLSARGPEHFGSDPERPTFVFHSIVGLRQNSSPTSTYGPQEPLVTETCAGPASAVRNSGLVYQQLSRQTGGLRYPICELQSYDAIFRVVARDILVKSGVGCSLPVPEAPAGRRLELDRANVVYEADGAEPVVIEAVSSMAECAAGGFVLEQGRIELCPNLCDTLGELPSARVSISFDCNALVNVR